MYIEKWEYSQPKKKKTPRLIWPSHYRILKPSWAFDLLANFDQMPDNHSWAVVLPNAYQHYRWVLGVKRWVEACLEWRNPAIGCGVRCESGGGPYKSNAATHKPYAPLLYDFRCLLTRLIQIQVVHVYREGNRWADALAWWGSNMAEAFVVFDSPPSPDVVSLVNMDSVGMFVNRIAELDLNSTMR